MGYIDNRVIFSSGKYSFILVNMELRLLRGGKIVACFPLIPKIASKNSGKLAWNRIKKKDGITWQSQLGEINLIVVERNPYYSFKSSIQFLKSIIFFPSAKLEVGRWQTLVYNGQDRIWYDIEDASIEIKSCNEVRGAIDATWFPNVSPRVAAFYIQDGEWLGISIPGPLPVGSTTFHLSPKHEFSIKFDYFRPGCEEAIEPRIYILPGLKYPEQVLEKHAEITRGLGYYRDRSGHPSWWGIPMWSIFDELATYGKCVFEPPDAKKSPLKRRMIKEWVKKVEAITRVKKFLVGFDQGYFKRYGEYVPVDSLGGTQGLRTLIDELRKEGKRIGLYMHQYFVDLNIPVIKEHPEWIARGTEIPVVKISEDMEITNIDWTHPGAREYMKERIRYIVSDEKGCLNADWISFTNTQVPDPRKFEFHNPDWAMGDLMAYKVMREIRDTAKKYKPDCLISFIGSDPFIQQFPDLCWVNESWTETCDNWFQIARIITRVLPGTLIATSPYIMSHQKFLEFVIITPTYGVATALPLSQIHTGGHSPEWEDMRPEDHRRWRASWQVYINAPMTTDQERRLDFSGSSINAWRKYTKGPLANFYAAKNFGRRSFVTYSENEARVMAIDYCIVDIPLPPESNLISVEKILQSNKAKPAKFTVIEEDKEKFVRMELEDSGSGLFGKGETLFYRIKYKLQTKGE